VCARIDPGLEISLILAHYVLAYPEQHCNTRHRRSFASSWRLNVGCRLAIASVLVAHCPL